MFVFFGYTQFYRRFLYNLKSQSQFLIVFSFFFFFHLLIKLKHLFNYSKNKNSVRKEQRTNAKLTTHSKIIIRRERLEHTNRGIFVVVSKFQSNRKLYNPITKFKEIEYILCQICEREQSNSLKCHLIDLLTCVEFYVFRDSTADHLRNDRRLTFTWRHSRNQTFSIYF